MSYDNSEDKEAYLTVYFAALSELLLSVDHSKLKKAVEFCERIKKDGKKIIIVGNGGSSAIASHASVDFTKAAGIRAVAFSDPALLTCFGNDYGYENWVTEAFKAYLDRDDLVILISSSGKSANMVNAANYARSRGNCNIITFSGFSEDNPLRKIGDINFYVPSKVYNFVENIHQAWLLSLVDAINKTVIKI